MIADAERSDRQADRPFSCNVNDIRREVMDGPIHRSTRRNGQAYFLVKGSCDVYELAGLDDGYFVPPSAQMGNTRFPGPNDTIYLRPPSVGREQNAVRGSWKVFGCNPPDPPQKRRSADFLFDYVCFRRTSRTSFLARNDQVGCAVANPTDAAFQ